MENKARVVQISVNPQGGVPKMAVAEAAMQTGGVAGDKQRNRKLHGGPRRAVCLYSLEIIERLQDEGHAIDCGTTGENLTLAGLDWNDVVPKSRLYIGDAVLEITQYTAPCVKIAASFVDGDFVRASQKVHPGWSCVYARVLQEGTVRTGDAVRLEQPSAEQPFVEQPFVEQPAAKQPAAEPSTVKPPLENS